MKDATIRLSGLTKDFGALRAVDQLSVTIPSGRVTALLGPNGAGKTTTMRMLLGLIRPTSGTATIGGVPYAELPQPLRWVGAALEASDVHPGRSARDHLGMLAPLAGVSAKRCDAVLDLVGLTDAAQRRVGQFSLGMRQRLGLATALLGDAPVLILDEPSNGLDPEGIAWLREFLRELAQEGRTVVVSSHLLSEVEHTADDVIIMARGRLIQHGPMAELAALSTSGVRVAGPDLSALKCLIDTQAWSIAREPTGGEPTTFLISGESPASVGAAAYAAHVEIHELSRYSASLEEIFLQLVDTTERPSS